MSGVCAPTSVNEEVTMVATLGDDSGEGEGEGDDDKEDVFCFLSSFPIETLK